MSKPLSAEALRLLQTVPRYLDSDFVIPSLFDGSKPMSKHTYSAGWRRILERAGLPHCGTHAVRHRAATDIANSGVPVKVGMALTAHKTVTMFMRYVHTEDDPIRAAAETVANRRRSVVGGAPLPALSASEIPAAAAAAPIVRTEAPAAPARLLGLEDVAYTSRTKMGNYRPYRKRKGENRAEPPKAHRGAESEEVQHV